MKNCKELNKECKQGLLIGEAIKSVRQGTKQSYLVIITSDYLKQAQNLFLSLLRDFKAISQVYMSLLMVAHGLKCAKVQPFTHLAKCLKICHMVFNWFKSNGNSLKFKGDIKNE